MTDIEDINKIINNNEQFKIYNQIIISLLEWVTNYNKSDLSNLKNEFATELNRLYRKKNFIVKKSILTNVLRNMINTDKIDNIYLAHNTNLLKILLQKKLDFKN